MNFLTRQRLIILLAAVMIVAMPGISYAQLDLKGKAVETLTNGVMKELDKKFAEMVAKESLSAAVKTNIVKNLSEMSRPIVKKIIDGAASGKLPSQAELVNSVMKDITPRIQELVKVALTDGGNLDAIAVPAGAAGFAPAAGQGAAAVSASSAVGFDDEKDFTVEILKESNSVRITKYAGTNTELRIPPRLGDRPVPEIGEKAFVKKGLVSVVIPESIIFIGNQAFADNQIADISIGANVYVANNAFENTGIISLFPGFYNSQGRGAGTYNISWRLVGAAAPQQTVQPAAQPSPQSARTGSNNTVSASKPAAAASTASPELNGVFKGNGHRYEIIEVSCTWTEAKEDCEKRGGYLATITSKEEQDFIRNLFSKQGKKNYYWLGGYIENKYWKWVTGENFLYKNWGERLYGGNAAFIRDLPNNSSNKGKWIAFDGGMVKDDWWGFSGYICEWDAE
jgi:hypothetical protein